MHVYNVLWGAIQRWYNDLGKTLCKNEITAGVLGQTHDYSVGESRPDEVLSV